MPGLKEKAKQKGAKRIITDFLESKEWYYEGYEELYSHLKEKMPYVTLAVNLRIPPRGVCKIIKNKKRFVVLAEKYLKKFLEYQPEYKDNKIIRGE